ncbi:MAG: hypothetical protein ACHQ01_02885 [Candidatus Limnocylindrales bacterium]
MFRRRDRREGASASEDELSAEADARSDEPQDLADEFGGEIEDEDLEDQPEDMTADLESQAADYLAGNDVWMYGPNAEAVLEILDRLEELVPAEARPLAEAWQAIPKSDRDRARKAARKLAEFDEEMGRHLQLAREAVGTWMAVTGPFPEFVNADPDWSRLCAQSGEAALDAATAVILEGKIDEFHYESLLEPWTQTMAELDAAAEAARIEGSPEGEPDEELAPDEEDEEFEAEGEFGPNSDAVSDFLTRLWLLAPEQVGRLVSGWQNASRDELKTAHENLRALAEEDPEWRDQVRGAQEKLAPWLNSGRIQETSSFLGQSGQGESRKMAGPALADAVAALVLGDLLERRDAEALYGPWFNLIGAPPLPESNPDEPAAGAAKSAAKGDTKGASKSKTPAATAGPKKSAVAGKSSAGKSVKAAKPGAGGGKAAGAKAGPGPKSAGAKAAPGAKSAGGSKSSAAKPVANQLRGEAKPNVLKKK